MNLEESVVSWILTLSHLLCLLERCLSVESTLIHFWLTASQLASFLSLLRGWDRNHLLEEFCLWYPWKFIVTNPLLRNVLIGALATNQLKFHCWPRWECFYTCYLGNDAFSSIWCNVSVLVAVEIWLPSRFLAMDALHRLHCCGFQASCHNIL
jgi:hypothetical protein